MSDYRPQIEKQLTELASLCCEAIQNGAEHLPERSESLIEALLRSGFSRNSHRSLQVEIENRVKELCQDRAMHRRGAISSITSQLQSKYEEKRRWETQQAGKENDAKAANISSATGS
jgi:hypothetical protein